MLSVDYGHHSDCGMGCLFNIRTDPHETNDLAEINPGLLESMRARFLVLNATQFDAPKLAEDAELCRAYFKAHDGYLGPYLVEPAQWVPKRM